MEAERPCCYKEYCDAESSWEEQGVRIKWTRPKVPGTSKVSMLSKISLRDNPEGIYREIDLPYDTQSRKWDDWGVTTYEFGNEVYPTHQDEYRLTFNVKIGRIMMWANVFQTDHVVTVIPAREINVWTNQSNISQITQSMYIGNFVSVMTAEEMGFDAVLNLDTSTDEKAASNVNLLRAFKSSGIEQGAGNEIPEEKIKEIVTWLQCANMRFNKILIGDHDGLGRVGSVMTAYIFATNPNLSFEEAYDLVKGRKFLYCHKGLKDTLYRCYPRD